MVCSYLLEIFFSVVHEIMANFTNLWSLRFNEILYYYYYYTNLQMKKLKLGGLNDSPESHTWCMVKLEVGAYY